MNYKHWKEVKFQWIPNLLTISIFINDILKFLQWLINPTQTQFLPFPNKLTIIIQITFITIIIHFYVLSQVNINIVSIIAIIGIKAFDT